jgi:hypothetical protein
MGRKEVLERLTGVIDFRYEKYLLEHFGRLPSYYLDSLKDAHDQLLGFVDDSFERLCLSIILLELSWLHNNTVRDEVLYKKIKPTLSSGANDLNKVIEAYKEHPQNVECIDIKVKHPDNYLKIPTSDIDTNVKKDPMGRWFQVTGYEPIKLMMKAVLTDHIVNKVKGLAKSEDEIEYGISQLPTGKTSVTNSFFKKGAFLLNDYLKAHVDIYRSERETFYCCALLLQSIGIRPDYRNIDTLILDPKKRKKSMINNISRVIKPPKVKSTKK